MEPVKAPEAGPSPEEDASNPLWQAACALWENEAVRSVCLALQDQHGLNPNELLFAIWCAGQHRAVRSGSLADSAGRQWNVEVTQPLRAARRQATGFDNSPELVINSLKQVELQSEQNELHLLYAALDSLSAPDDRSREKLIQANLNELLCFEQLSQSGQVGPSDCERLLKRLAGYGLSCISA